MANNSVSMCGVMMLKGGECKAKAKYEITNKTGGECKAACGRHLKMALKQYKEPFNACVFIMKNKKMQEITNPLQITQKIPQKIPQPPQVCRGDCSICMNVLSDNDTITLPVCKHILHQSCMTTWTNSCHSQNKHSTCPLCRSVYKPYVHDVLMEDVVFTGIINENAAVWLPYNVWLP
jgi:hypothetical protein